jgi:hypothetical protein
MYGSENLLIILVIVNDRESVLNPGPGTSDHLHKNHKIPVIYGKPNLIFSDVFQIFFSHSSMFP